MNKTFLIAGLIAGSLMHGESMKLVDKKTNQVIVEFIDGSVKFYSRLLEKEFKKDGIAIPPFMRDQFEGKALIFIDDPLFQKAFVEVYWPFYMATANSPYEWQE